MFLCFRSIVHCFQRFVRGPSPFGKKFPMKPPYPSEITAFESRLPLGISNDLPWEGGGGRYFLEPHNLYFHTITKSLVQSNYSENSPPVKYQVRFLCKNNLIIIFTCENICNMLSSTNEKISVPKAP